MTETIGLRPWMSEPATGEVMDALARAGGQDCARFVGGCIRNTVLSQPVDDIDIATTLTPEQVVKALETADLRAVPTGIDHGTVTALAGGRAFEITTLRVDLKTDGRHALVAFTDDWARDAARRDFRFNALYADRQGRLFDPTRHGLEDARAGAVVFVGDPEARIEEDALRILRFFRFLALYGRGEPDARALAACRKHSGLVESLSAERVAHELFKLLSAEDPRAAVRLMASSGVLARLLPHVSSLQRFEALVEIEGGVLFSSDALIRLAALLPGKPGAGREAAQRLRLSRVQSDRLEAALGAEPALTSWMSPRQTRRAVWTIGAETFRDRVLLAWASSDRPAAGVQWRALLPIAETWPAPRLPLSGDDVMAAGVPPGPLVGKVLREVEAWWIDQDFPDDRLSLIERLKAVAQGMAY
jgi:poly(A) polymerase